MLDNDNTPGLDPSPDADAVYRNYLRTCQHVGVKPVARGHARKLIAQWSDTIAASRSVPPVKH